MAAAGIVQTIDAALAHELRTGHLRRHLELALPELHDKLMLPPEGPLDALMGFVTRYVQSVPGGLRLVTAASQSMGFFDYAAPFLHLAEDYFLHPPDALATEVGLQAILDEAFLAHRLLEEVNDHHIRHLGSQLLPLDMTEANIIVHHLLGDEFAIRLEQLVQFTAAQLLDKEHVWHSVRTQPGTAVVSALTSDSLDDSQRPVRLRLAS
ncbi:MAG: hypothetical protein HKN19_16395 [Halioglobus sp.]|nr:hypothetical protein [Halioglobus sp.]